MLFSREGFYVAFTAPFSNTDKHDLREHTLNKQTDTAERNVICAVVELLKAVLINPVLHSHSLIDKGTGMFEKM